MKSLANASARRDGPSRGVTGLCEFAARTLTRTLTGEQRRDPLGRQLVRLRQQVRVRGEHRFRVVTEAGGDDVDGDALGERERGGGMPEDVQRPGGEAGRLPVLPERLGQPFG